MATLSSENREMVEELTEAILKVVGTHTAWRPLLDEAADAVWERQKEVRKRKKVSPVQDFKARHKLMTWGAYATKYGLHTTEREAAKKIVATLRYGKKGTLYFKDQPPTEEQRYEIASQTHMYKWDACAYLGLTDGEFEKYKRQFGIVHQREVPMMADGNRIYNAYLYSKVDIDMLAELIANRDDELFMEIMRPFLPDKD